MKISYAPKVLVITLSLTLSMAALKAAMPTPTPTPGQKFKSKTISVKGSPSPNVIRKSTATTARRRGTGTTSKTSQSSTPAPGKFHYDPTVKPTRMPRDSGAGNLPPDPVRSVDTNSSMPPASHHQHKWSGLPDLAFIQLAHPDLVPATGVDNNGEYFIRYAVKNVGTAPTGNGFEVQLLIYETGDGGKIIEVKHFNLPFNFDPGTSYEVTFKMATKYVHKNAYRAAIDPADLVKESNEDNNLSLLQQFGSFPSAGD